LKLAAKPNYMPAQIILNVHINWIKIQSIFFWLKKLLNFLLYIFQILSLDNYISALRKNVLCLKSIKIIQKHYLLIIVWCKFMIFVKEILKKYIQTRNLLHHRQAAIENYVIFLNFKLNDRFSYIILNLKSKCIK
jgi:hypothetical protein